MRVAISLRRALSASAVSAIALLTLAACGSSVLYHGQTAIRRAGSGIEVVTCQPVVASNLEIAELDDPQESLEDEHADIYEASGKASLEKGDVFGLHMLPPGMGVDLEVERPIKPTSTIVVHINRGDKDVVRSYFRVPPRGLSSDTWLRADGKVTSVPCETPFSW